MVKSFKHRCGGHSCGLEPLTQGRRSWADTMEVGVVRAATFTSYNSSSHG